MDTETEFPGGRGVTPRVRSGPQTLTARLAHWARVRPYAVAVTDGECILTWSELHEAVTSCRDRLLERGLAPGGVVAVRLARSTTWIVRTLSVWAAGAAYMPLAPSGAPERNALMLDQVMPDFILESKEGGTDGGLAPEGMSLGAVHGGVDAARGPLWRDAAYVIFTSGSTGVPKGVINTFAGLDFAISSMHALLPIGVDDVVLQHLPMSFDASLFEIALSLASGAALAVTPSEMGPGRELGDFVTREGITCLATTPSILRLLPPETASSVRTVVTGGEILTRELAATWVPRAKLFNVYGPTEVALWSSVSRVEDPDAITVGRPLPGLDFMLTAVEGSSGPPTGSGDHTRDSGELVITGESVASGYVRAEPRDAVRFRGGHGSGQGVRGYRTGDLLALDHNGDYRFLGRADRQAKVRGVRIELGEVEAHIGRTPGVDACRVVAVGTGGGHRLAAFVTPASTAVRDRSEEANHLLRMAELVETHYRTAARDAADGWVTSRGRSPLTARELRAWRNNTATWIIRHAPTSVVELGCGGGELAASLLPYVTRYVGIDVSETVVRRCAEAGPPLSKGAFIVGGAEVLDQLPAGAFDAVVVNSVVQYFPSLAYLDEVLAASARLLSERGVILVGDVRDLSVWKQYVAWREDAEAVDPPSDSEAEYLLRRERELLIDPAYFRSLSSRLPGISHAVPYLRALADKNELTRFRYDVLIYRHTAPRVPMLEVEADSYARQREALNSSCSGSTLVRGMRNADLTGPTRNTALGGDPTAGSPDWDPCEEVAAGQRQVRVALSGEAPDRFDLLMVPEELVDTLPSILSADLSARPEPATRPRQAAGLLPSWANDPARSLKDAELVERCRAQAERSLPAQMRPSEYVVCSSFPLSPHGKVLDAELPRIRGDRHDGYVAGDSAEERVSLAWKTVLGYPPAHGGQSFFETGGTSLQFVELLEALRSFGVAVPTSSGLRSPSPRGLAELAVGEADLAPALLPLNAQASAHTSWGPDDVNTELAVCVHALAGTVHCYTEIAALLGVPVFGLTCGTRLPDTLEALVSAYAQLVDTVATGRTTVHLIGWSLGGAIAHEMACVLRTWPYDVRVSLIDAPVPLADDDAFEDRWRRLTEQSASGAPLWASPVELERARALVALFASYKPSAAAEAIRLLVAADRPEEERRDPMFSREDLGWSEAGPVRMVILPGGHHTILNSDPAGVADALRSGASPRPSPDGPANTATGMPTARLPHSEKGWILTVITGDWGR